MGKTVLPGPGEVTGPSRCRRFLTPADEASIFTLDHFPLWYRQAAEQPPGSVVFNLYSAEGPGNLHPKLQGGAQGIPPPTALGVGDRHEIQDRTSRPRSPLTPLASTCTLGGSFHSLAGNQRRGSKVQL